MRDPEGKAPQWLRDYYEDVDNMRLDAYLARHTDDVVVQFGNNPHAHGKGQVGGAIGHFWETIKGLDHEFLNVYQDGETTALEALIHYRRHDDVTVPVPCTTLIHRAGEQVDFVRIFIDLAPVFADTVADEATPS